MTVATAQGIQFLNLAYFGRPADPASLSAWPASGLSLEAIVLQFTGTAEYATNTVQPNSAVNPGGGRTFNDTNLINTFYQRLFGRLATSAEVAGWADALAQGTVNYDYLGITILQAGLNLPAGTEMRQVLIAKFDSNQLYTGILFNNPVDAAAYSTAAAIQNGIAFSSATTTTTPQTSAQAQTAVNQMVANSGAAGGQTFTLTVNADGPGAVAPAANTTGPNGIATYNGTISTGGNAGGDAGTLNSFDNLAGATGFANILNARVTNVAGGDTTISPVGSNIANVRISSVDASNNTAALNLATVAGVSSVSFVDTLAASRTAFINAPATATVTLNNADGVRNRVNFLGAANRTGNANAFTLNVLNGTGTAAALAGFGIITNAAGFNTADATFEVANISVGAGSANYLTFDIGGANITTVNVSGSGGTADTNGYVLTLTENANFANVTAINASSLTGGGLDIATTLQQNVTVTGSAGNDRLLVTAGVGNLTALDQINLGTGTNTLAFGTTNDFRNATIPNQVTLINAITTAQVLESTNNGATQIRAADFTTINTFVLSTARTNQVLLTGIETADTVSFASSIQLAAGADGAAGAPGANGTAGTDAVRAGGAAVAQAPTFVLAGGVTISGGAGGAGGAGNAAAANGGVGAVGANALDITNGGTNITTLTINSIGTTANVIQGGAGGAGGDGNAAGNSSGGNGGAAAAAIDNGAGLQNVVITGSQNLTIAGAAGGTGGTFNAAGTGAGGTAGAASGGFANAVNVNASTFTGVLTLTGSNAADVIVGGSGADVLTTFGGLDSLTGNGANDNYRINGAAATTATAYVTITDFNASGDTLSVLSQVGNAGGALNGTATFNATAVDVSGAGTLAAALDLAAANTGGGGNSLVRWFNYTGNTYVVVDNSNNATLQANDGVIQLLGNVTLNAANVNFV